MVDHQSQVSILVNYQVLLELPEVLILTFQNFHRTHPTLLSWGIFLLRLKKKISLIYSVV